MTNSNENLSNENFWKKSGDEYFKHEKYEEAIKCYQKAVDIDPNYAAAWNNLGFAFFKLGRIEDAKKCKDKIKAIQERSSDFDKRAEQRNTPAIEHPQPVPVEKPLIVTRAPYNHNYLLIGLFIAGIICLFIPPIGYLFIIPIVIASAYFVFKDAQEIGAGQAPRSWSPLILGLFVFLFWIIALPIYILMRRSIFNKGLSYPPSGSVSTAFEIGGLKTAFIAIGGVIVLLIIAVAVATFVFGITGTSDNKVPQSNELPSFTFDSNLARDYVVIKSEDISIKALDKPLSMYSSSELTNLPMNIRMTYRVVVPMDISEEELKATFIKIVADITKTNQDIDEISIYAYDRKENVDGPYTFGMCEWCPNGEWAGVTSTIARTNDRSNYEFVFDIREKVGNIEQGNVPSQRDFEISNELEQTLLNYPTMSEDSVKEKICRKYGITTQELDGIYSKVIAYKYW